MHKCANLILVAESKVRFEFYFYKKTIHFLIDHLRMEDTQQYLYLTCGEDFLYTIDRETNKFLPMLQIE